MPDTILPDIHVVVIIPVCIELENINGLLKTLAGMCFSTFLVGADGGLPPEESIQCRIPGAGW